MRERDRGHYSSSPYVYNDSPQGIGYSATISAPHMHAHCLELLSKRLTKDSHVLDVGSGSGYLTACFATILRNLGGGKCYGIEHIDELVEDSKRNIAKDDKSLLEHVDISVGDGFEGLARGAPFQAIHVGAASPDVPTQLLDQLAIGGSLVIPVGPENRDQYLYLLEKVPAANSAGYEIKQNNLCGVRYVPLTTKEYQLSKRF